MNYLKKLGKIFLVHILIIIISCFFITILSYFNIIGGVFLKLLKVIVPIISLFISGVLIGKISDKKGWLEGLKYGLVYVLIIFLLGFFVFRQRVNLRIIIFYVTLTTSTVIGSMIGINHKKESK